MQPRVDYDAPLRDGSRLTDVLRRNPRAVDFVAQLKEHFAKEENIFEGNSSAQSFTTSAHKDARSKLFESYQQCQGEDDLQRTDSGERRKRATAHRNPSRVGCPCKPR